jgi:hypothetical protein
MLATDYGIDGGYESKSKVQFEVVQRQLNDKEQLQATLIVSSHLLRRPRSER